jgi:hypothetical protein
MAMDAATFKVHYLPAAKRLQDAYGHCQIHTVSLTTNDKDDEWFTTTYRFVFSGESMKCEFEHEDVNEKWTRTLAGTPGVNFMILTKNDQQPLLEQVDRSSLGHSVAKERILARADTALRAYSLFGTPLSERLQSDRFRIRDIEEHGEEIKAHFQNDDETVSQRGWFTVLPKRGWVIDSWEATLSKPGQDYTWRSDGKATYGGEVPIPQLKAFESHYYHADRTYTESTTVNLLKFEDAAESEFMLSHYGYDDRLGMPSSFFRSLPFLLIVVGACCLAAVAAIRHRRKRVP